MIKSSLYIDAYSAYVVACLGAIRSGSCRGGEWAIASCLYY